MRSSISFIILKFKQKFKQNVNEMNCWPTCESFPPARKCPPPPSNRHICYPHWRPCWNDNTFKIKKIFELSKYITITHNILHPYISLLWSVSIDCSTLNHSSEWIVSRARNQMILLRILSQINAKFFQCLENKITYDVSNRSISSTGASKPQFFKFSRSCP